MRRREFLTVAAGGLGGVVVYSLDGKALWLGRGAVAEAGDVERGGANNGPAHDAAGDKAVRIPLRFFTEQEAVVVAAAAGRIFPADESGPGAKEAGVAIYIDRQLAGPYGRDAHRYTQGPFEENAAAEFGYQGEATPREIYRAGLKELAGLKGLAGFARLSASQQDDALRKIEASNFFALLRQHTIEGMFCDPLHGGNVDMVGWQLIGYPGPRMNNFDDVDKHYGEAFRPKATRLGEAAGHAVRGSEDAK
jgi:gluconate 2-dehydrogenase gamma chain